MAGWKDHQIRMARFDPLLRLGLRDQYNILSIDCVRGNLAQD